MYCFAHTEIIHNFTHFAEKSITSKILKPGTGI